ncbi:MAG: AmmeMemoRadiSam system protein A [Campylobacterales bacterium]
MEAQQLIKLARGSIAEEFGEKFDLESFATSELKDEGASFVTITQNGELRGCIGSLIATSPLYRDIAHNAKSAAFKDPRFRPLSKEEFEDIKIEVSVLTPPKELEYSDIEDLKSKIIPNKHGVILTNGYNKATFLPQVWEQLPTFDLFFAHLCQKSGQSLNCLEAHPTIQTYEALKYKEE